MTNRTCTVVDCQKPQAAGQMCAMHYARFTRHGDPTITVRLRQVGSCNIEGCDEPKESKGWCEKHARRARLNGDPLIVLQGKPASGSLNHNWVGDQVSYEGWHQRVRKAKGAASLHACVDCGDAASDWSYDHASDDERTSNDGPYALDLDHYVPRCRRCHITFDFAYTGRSRN